MVEAKYLVVKSGLGEILVRPPGALGNSKYATTKLAPGTILTLQSS